MYQIRIEWADGEVEVRQVEGWRIADPAGWVQVMEGTSATFYREDAIRSITVPVIITNDPPETLVSQNGSGRTHD